MVNKNIAIVVGASGSLGYELTCEYLKNNYIVYAIYNSHEIDLESDNLYKFKYDLEKETEYIDLKNKLESESDSNTKISIVYAAGVHSRNYIENYYEEEYIKNMRINTTGFIYIFKNIVDTIKKVQSSNIVLLGTNLLSRKNRGGLYYVMSKGMQKELVKQIAYEYGEYNILINQLSPGMFLSNMNASMDKEKIKNIENNIPIKRIGNAKELANFIVNFTETNTLITGVEITLDGGNTIGY